MTAVIAAVGGVHELLILFGAPIIMVLAGAVARRRPRVEHVSILALAHFNLAIDRANTDSALTGAAAAGAGAGAATASFGLWPLFLVFLKTGAVLFGSGYVLLAFLRADLVERLHWLTERQLLDAIAVGQVTPGPVFTTATFIGYLLGGGAGAVVSTVGIFLPAFIFVALSSLLLPRLRRSPVTSAVLDAVNVASLALMAVVTWELSRAALVDPLAVALAASSALLLFGVRLNSAWLVLGGAVVGLAVKWPVRG